MRDRRKLMIAIGERTTRDTGIERRFPRVTTAQRQSDDTMTLAIQRGFVTYGNRIKGLS